ncbi:Endonuclease IV (EC [Olavius algarvensis Delta 1 endosymbiont]|nr:Endonuclease IV (EC [Olavius algarvensis Delta 1 endosymbiont]
MIKIGPAGSDGLGNLKGVQKVAEMGLDCMEVAFTYGVRMDLKAAKSVGALARELGIILSVHAPYYINLASDEKEKYDASCRRILDSCERAHAMGARNVVFHAGFYQKRSAGQTYKLIKKAISALKNSIVRAGWQVELCPEITGKPSQFGSLSEILKLKQETGCGITVDFSHLYARHQGDIDYAKILGRLPKKFHAHFSGIEYGDKGERKHIRTTRQFFEPLARALIQHRADITLISESPKPYEDAIMMIKLIKNLEPDISPHPR